MSAILLRDEIVHYEVLGRGRPLIFVHDWVGSWRYWIPAMQAASISYRAYALDLWGFGDSAKNPNYYSIEQQVGLLSEFIGDLGIGKIALIGHGLGAVVSLVFTSRHPTSVDRLMAVGLPGGPETVHNRFQFATPAELADWLLGSSPVSEAARGEAPKADPKAILLSLANLQDYDLRGMLRAMATPSLLVHGQNDPAVNGHAPDELALLPEIVHHMVIENAGHFPMLDEPSKFNRLLVDFLAQNSGESPRQLQFKAEWKRRVR